MGICPSCKTAVLQQHPMYKFSYLGWWKCPLCGFCIQKDPNDTDESLDEDTVQEPVTLEKAL